MRILHLEDNAEDAELVRALITEVWPDCFIRCVCTRFAFVGELHMSQYDLILSDFALTAMNGLDALKIASECAPDTPFIFLSGTIGEDRAIEAMKAGAADYVLKDRMKRLVTVIERALRERDERRRRRNAEGRIRELAEFLDQAREAVVVTDLAGKITFWNRGAELISGWSPEQALDKTCDSLFGATTTSLLAAAYKSALEHGEWVGEVEITHRLGHQRLMELRITLIRDDNGRPRARLALGTDITERRQDERRIREQAEMLNQAGEAIFITDLADRIIYWNAGAGRLFGWRSEEALGRPAGEILDPAVSDRSALASPETLAKGQWSGEVRMHTRAREPIFVESRQSLIRDEAGKPKARLCINTDITDRKKLEEQFLRAQRMENIGLLAAGIAHDLNNMLAPILLAAPMLRDHVRDPSALALLGTLEKSAERGANLVRQILAFAHGATGEHRLLQVKHLLRDITSVISGTFPKSIRLEDYIPSDLWPIKGNPTQVHQVLLNLCVNARDAMPNGGTLRLRAENRVLDDKAADAIRDGRPGAFLVLQVEDTGTGIAPDVLARMWEPFFTTKESDKGTGLGLSTVRGIIENHGGFIDVVTTLGQGSGFHVYLPAAESGPADKLPGAPSRPVRSGMGELILVVDDEHNIREMTKTILTRHGYRVIVAEDGNKAAELFAQQAAEIRLVITDLSMPNLDGVMLGRALRQINPSSRLLVISGLSSVSNRPDMRPEDAGDAFLHKPFRPETLLNKVAELLRGAVSTGNTPPPWLGR